MAFAGSNPIRGLQVFISDIRSCRNKDQEEKRVNKELANIRTKFKKGDLDGYNRKKYVAKIVYMYMLGYEVDIGHMEAVTLLSSNKYSEKSIGYIACTVMLDENHALIPLIINSIRKDLISPNEVWQSLALASICNIGGKEMAESLSTDVQKILVSATSRKNVKKKAALCLLRLFRKIPDIIKTEEWVERLSGLLQSGDLGVVTAVMSLILGLVSKDRPGYASLVPTFASLLNTVVIKQEIDPAYQYYGVPAPWLVVKLLRVLQYYEVPINATLRQKIDVVLQRIISNTELTKNTSHNNALYAVLFEAIGLIIHYNADRELVVQAATLLGRFISARETNIRYLGLDAMAHLSMLDDTQELIKRHQETVLNALRDADISIRRRALDLLYAMCDKSNSAEIVGALLTYLVLADYGIREELVLKIAILAEKFAADLSWYVDTMITLILYGGEFVGDDVWFRVVQIITNNEDLRQYATATLFKSVQVSGSPEATVKLAGYVLGEYGNLIAEDEESAPMKQIEALSSRFGSVSASGKALLLSTYVKFINLYPEIRDKILQVIQSHDNDVDPEIQQRACEYLQISRLDNEELMLIVLDIMPAFPERESTLMKRFKAKQEDSADAVVWSLDQKGFGDVEDGKDKGGEGEGEEKVEVEVDVSVGGGVESPRTPTRQKPKDEGDADTSLIGLSTPAQPSAADAKGTAVSTEELLGDLMGITEEAAPAAPVASSGEYVKATDEQMKHWFNALCVKSDGVLYEDSAIQLGFRTEYHDFRGRVILFIGNRTDFALENFSTNIAPVPYLRIQTANVSPVIQPKQQVQQLIAVESLSPFSDSPVLHVSFKWSDGTKINVSIKLPITCAKFCEPFKLSAADFFKRWKMVSGQLLEYQGIHKSKTQPIDSDALKNTVTSLKLASLDGIDPNPANVVGCGVFYSKGGQIGIMLRIECNMNAGLLRVTVRTLNAQITNGIKTLLVREIE